MTGGGRPSRDRFPGGLAALAGLLPLLCCLGPVLVLGTATGGGIGALGAGLGSPLLVVAAVAVAAGTVVVLVRRRRAKGRDGSRC